jgi:hypothetical protein
LISEIINEVKTENCIILSSSTEVGASFAIGNESGNWSKVERSERVDCLA